MYEDNFLKFSFKTNVLDVNGEFKVSWTSL